VFGTACVDLILRWIGNKQKEASLTTAFYFLSLSALFTLPWGLGMPTTPLVDLFTNAYSFWLLLVMGLLGALGMVLKSESFKLAPVSVISPVAYSILLWSVFYDWLFWQHVPSANVYVGAGVIISANMFVVWREKQLKKTNPPTVEEPIVA